RADCAGRDRRRRQLRFRQKTRPRPLPPDRHVSRVVHGQHSRRGEPARPRQEARAAHGVPRPRCLQLRYREVAIRVHKLGGTTKHRCRAASSSCSSRRSDFMFIPRLPIAVANLPRRSAYRYTSPGCGFGGGGAGLSLGRQTFPGAAPFSDRSRVQKTVSEQFTYSTTLAYWRPGMRWSLAAIRITGPGDRISTAATPSALVVAEAPRAAAGAGLPSVRCTIL